VYIHHDGLFCPCCGMQLRLTPSSRRCKEILRKRKASQIETVAELNKTRKDYDRLESAIRRLNPEIDEDGVYGALSQINESSFPYTLDPMETNEKIRAKLVGLSRSGGLEPITVTQNKNCRLEE
jgi:SMC interacting uncharacterized protein involved in chromosome segregation